MAEAQVGMEGILTLLGKGQERGQGQGTPQEPEELP